MSISFGTTSTYAGRDTSGLGAGTSATFAFWHRRTTTNARNQISVSTWPGGGHNLFYDASGVFDFEVNTGGYTPANAFTHTINEWAYYAMKLDVTTLTIWAWDKDGNRTNVYGPTDIGIGGVFTGIYLGAVANAALGQYRYFRFWNAGLDVTEIEAHRISATAAGASIQTNAASLKGDWPLIDSSTGGTAADGDYDASGVGNTLNAWSGTITTSAEEPTLGGGASAVAAIAGRHYARMRNG